MTMNKLETMKTFRKDCQPRQLLLLMLALLANTTFAQQTVVRDDRGNIQFDPDEENTTTDCGIPSYIDTEDYFKSKEGLCDESTARSLDSFSDEELQALAVEYAPVIFFHPMEKYTMSGVNYTLPTLSNTDENTGKIFRQTKEDRQPYMVEDTLNTSFLLQTTKDPIYALNPNSFYFATDRAYEMFDSELTEEYGSGYSVDGRSKAPLYWNVYDSGNNTLTFNYWMYFPFNGEGGMGVLGVYNGTQKYTRFTLKPYGIHEGDWESINVMICAGGNADEGSSSANNNTDTTIFDPPLATKFHQHEWSVITDCTIGECKFYKDTFHPVGFTALNSHATYSQSSKEIVYTQIKLGFLYSLQAFVVVDRTLYKKPDGTYNYFFPTESNLERFQDPKSITEDSDPDYFWQAYGGRWGNSEGIKVERQQPSCLNDDQSGYVPCPTSEEDPVFDLVMQVMDIRPSTGTITDIIQSVSGQIAGIFSETSRAPLGPGSKGFWERWIEPRNAPVWLSIENKSITDDDYCAQLLFVEETYRAPVAPVELDLTSTIVPLVVVTCLLTLINMAFPLVIIYFQGSHPYQPIMFDDEGEPYDPREGGCGTRTYMLGAGIFSVFFLLLLVSGITFMVSIEGMLQLLESLVSGVDWSILFSSVKLLGACVLVVNMLLFVFLWMQAFEMRNMIQATYNHMARTKETGVLHLLYDHAYVNWNPTMVDVLFRIFFALLFLSLLFSLICFVLGIGAVGVSYSLVRVCNQVAGSLDGFCFDLSVVGVDKIACGDDFQQVCSDGASADGKNILWSGFFVFVSHFYLVGATGFAAHQRRSIPSLLAQYDLVASLRKNKKLEGDSISGSPPVLESNEDNEEEAPGS